MPESTQPIRLIGAGRSAQVFQGRLADGRSYAQKVFTGEGTSRLVLNLMTGAENPYRWSQDAMASAVARRQVLVPLLRYWFGDNVRLPDFYDWGWNREMKAYQCRVELIQGQHVPLEDPLHPDDASPFTRLQQQVMRPLQHHLTEAGFDGLLWQAGLGNPVAANNFMIEKTDTGETRWVWIDLESGVPALFALNVWQTLRFYLPKSIHHRRPLFDDVDVPALQRYLDRHRTELKICLGLTGWLELNAAVAELQQAQQRWKSLSRRERGLQAAHQLGRIDDKQLAACQQQPGRWSLLRGRLAVQRLVHSFSTKESCSKETKRPATQSQGSSLWKSIRRLGRQFADATYRHRRTGVQVRQQLAQWHQRGSLSGVQLRQLHQQLRQPQQQALLSLYAGHRGCQLLARLMVFGLLPLVWLLGLIGGGLALTLALLSGPVTRVGYATYQTRRQQDGSPVRLGTVVSLSALPLLGRWAYPMSALLGAYAGQMALMRFMIAASGAELGRRVPIWGGQDTATEHWGLRVALALAPRAQPATGHSS